MSEMVIGKRNGLISDWLSNRFRGVVRASLTLSIGPSATKSNRPARKVTLSASSLASESTGREDSGNGVPESSQNAEADGTIKGLLFTR
jgi:hypothetical protein